MTGADAEVCAQLGDELAAHRRPAVGVNRQLVRPDRLFEAGRFYHALRQAGVLVRRDHPAHDVPAEEIEDHIQRVIEVGDRPLQLRDVPRPDLIRRRGHELRFGVGRMPRLVPPLADLGCGVEDAIHRARRAEIGLLLEQRGLDFGWRVIDESLAVQHVEDRLPFGGDQRARRGRANGRCRRPSGLSSPIEGRACEADALTERRGLAGRGHGFDGDHQSVSSMSRGFRGIPRISATFFWRVMIVSTRASLRCRRRFSTSSCFTRGSTGLGAGPRLRARPATSSPCSRWRRQCTKCELYKPSRRNSAPKAPRFLHASASLRMRRRYSAVNCRRWTFAGTSGSGADARDVVGGAKAPVALRAPSASAPPTTSISTPAGMRIIHRTLPAPTLISPERLSHRLLAQGASPPPCGPCEIHALLGFTTVPFGKIRYSVTPL